MYLLNHKVVKKRTFQMCITAPQSAIQQAPVDQNNTFHLMSANESSAAKNTIGTFPKFFALACQEHLTINLVADEIL